MGKSYKWVPVKQPSIAVSEYSTIHRYSHRSDGVTWGDSNHIVRLPDSWVLPYHTILYHTMPSNRSLHFYLCTTVCPNMRHLNLTWSLAWFRAVQESAITASTIAWSTFAAAAMLQLPRCWIKPSLVSCEANPAPSSALVKFTNWTTNLSCFMFLLLSLLSLS